MKITHIILTFNHKVLAKETVAHNQQCAGATTDELIWVDNGSTDGIEEVIAEFNPDVRILNRENRGVAKGMNPAYAIAAGDYIVNYGYDIRLPDGWLSTIKRYLDAIPNTAVIGIPNEGSDYLPCRIGTVAVNGLPIHKTRMFSGAFVVSRKFWREVGYFREDFGLYGHEDTEWNTRADIHADKTGWLVYSIPHLHGIHMMSRESEDAYMAFKVAEARKASTQEALEKVAAAGHPYFNPYQ